MSKKGEIVSAEEQGEPESDSVFDFLYHDSRRIASFLSQFDDSGLLTDITQSESASKGSKRSKRLGFGGNTPVGGGNIELEIGPGEAGSESLVRVYDPFWANALQFLGVLEERRMIQRDIGAARIGQFALVKGSLVILDTSILKAVWDKPVVAKFLKDQAEAAAQAQAEAEAAAEATIASTSTPVNRQQRRTDHSKARKAKPQQQAVTESDLGLAIMPHMPHAGQMHIVADDFAVWATVAEGALVAPITELILKHGQKVAGQWSMLGILDALPFAQTEMLTPLELVRVGMTQESVSTAALQMGPFIRQALGRPILSYGMTPLLVFREVELGQTGI